MGDLSKLDVFVDLCAQREYLNVDSPSCCVNARDAARNVKHMMAFARWTKAPVIACVDARRRNDICLDLPRPLDERDPLRSKVGFTLLPSHTLVESDNCLSVPLDLLQRTQQAIFTKNHRDPFSNPKMDRLLTEMPARRFVIFGVSTEVSVRLLALGLLRRARQVTIIHDACGSFNPEEAAMSLRQLDVKGCKLATACDFLREAMISEGAKRRGRVRSRRWVA
jgi:nicotinamidase-related amidase